jgi:hypothetical protein
MTKKITEADIDKVIKMLEESDPEKATRENAIKVIEGMKLLAGTAIDRIDEDLKTGRLKVDEKGGVTRKTD